MTNTTSSTQTAQQRTNTKSPYTVVSDDRDCSEVVCATLYEACRLARDLYVNGFVVGVLDLTGGWVDWRSEVGLPRLAA